MKASQRLMGRHAPALRRAVVAGCLGIITALAVTTFASWQLALVAGWDATALTFLIAVWPMVLTSDAEATEEMASTEDDTRTAATLVLLAASVGSILGVVATLPSAAHEHGLRKGALIAVAVLTILLSWIVVNTVFLLRYADLQYSPRSDGIDFGPATGAHPTYLDFAYVAFTIGMTYQVSDTTIRDPRIRRTIIVHSLLAYLFGVVIVAGAINLFSGLAR
ncbi:hypothetical protein Cs7R123_11590 [Catellatospora sp. TT07R-123]|uniref:DUF1345 domain-containing protein n=1 Tax=Catellatospora sp. TT07R-123 TaxID=2733863 RepID=UPI001B2EE514|nr:DUF1345 domain-containing protein [Catellatospora sp. TT07R-123]GHJ43817.1 hypothetical protein Cs7R123_11590 [Catellatospora sp. TT07R-123]